jgi:hypothetical protein
MKNLRFRPLNIVPYLAAGSREPPASMPVCVEAQPVSAVARPNSAGKKAGFYVVLGLLNSVAGRWRVVKCVREIGDGRWEIFHDAA